MFCNKCGKRIDNVTSKFCAGCGELLSDEEKKVSLNKYPKPPLKKRIITNIIILSLLIIAVSIRLFMTFAYGAMESVNDVDNLSPQEVASIGVEEAMKEINVPYKIDDETTLINIEAVGSYVYYDYRVVKSSKDIDFSILKYELIKAVCSGQDTMELLDRDVIFAYRYNLIDKEEIVYLRKSDCL